MCPGKQLQTELEKGSQKIPIAQAMEFFWLPFSMLFVLFVPTSRRIINETIGGEAKAS